MPDSLAASSPARTGQFSPPKIPPGCSLSEADAEYLKARGVSRATAEAAGCYTATRPGEVPAAFSERQRRRVPALVVPHASPCGTVGYQKRDHRPGKDRKGKVLKWVSPPKDRARTVIACHPWTVGAVRNGPAPLWVVEGVTRMMALAELGIPAVSYAGCYSWQKDGEPLEDWQSVYLERLVLDVPDADARTNWQVQTMQAARVPYLESRGGRVLAVTVPEVNGDEHAGLDDYLASGGNPEALARSARPFEPVDVGRERLIRNEGLRRLVGTKVLEAAELPARKAAECNAAKVARHLAGTLAPDRGKMRPRGVEVAAGFAEIAEGVRLGSYQTVSKALDFLDEVGFLVIQRAPKGGRVASSYLLLDPSLGGVTLGVNKEGLRVGVKEGLKGGEEKGISSYQRDSYTSLHSTSAPPDPRTLPDAPALRNSKLVHDFETKGGRRVVVGSEYFRRYGSKRELIIRYLLERGACVETAELWEKFGSRTSTLPGFFRTWIRKMVADGVLRGDVGSVELSPNWIEALEAVRTRTDEDGDNRRQSAKYAERKRKRRERLEGERRGTVAAPEPVPDLVGPERAREIFDAAKERDHAARIEAQRSKVGTTPETFLLDTLEGVAGFGWRELGDLWRERGGKREDLARVVRDPATPWTFRREDGDGPLYVERRGSDVRTQKPREAESINTPPKKAPAQVVPMSKRAKNPDGRTGGEDLIKPKTPDPPEDTLDVFRNNPHARRKMLTKVNPQDGPRKMPPKVAGVYKHGPECDCWICGDDETSEAAAEPVEIGASA